MWTQAQNRGAKQLAKITDNIQPRRHRDGPASPGCVCPGSGSRLRGPETTLQVQPEAL